MPRHHPPSPVFSSARTSHSPTCTQALQFSSSDQDTWGTSSRSWPPPRTFEPSGGTAPSNYNPPVSAFWNRETWPGCSGNCLLCGLRELWSPAPRWCSRRTSSVADPRRGRRRTEKPQSLESLGSKKFSRKYKFENNNLTATAINKYFK